MGGQPEDRGDKKTKKTERLLYFVCWRFKFRAMEARKLSLTDEQHLLINSLLIYLYIWLLMSHTDPISLQDAAK